VDALPLIRFVGMSQEDVAKMCMEELAEVLTADEKLQIMQSSLLRKKKLLPPRLTRSPARLKQIEIPPREVHLIDLPYDKCNGNSSYHQKPLSFRLEFRVDQWAKLVGLDVAAGTAKSGKFFFVFSSKPENFKACGDSDTILEHATGQCLRVSPEIWLRPGCYFSIQFNFPLISNRSGLPRENYHHALRELTSTNGCVPKSP
jgi:hypothetical protein